MSIIWLSVVGLAFFLAWNLGANDVANAMGTSVGSRALTLRQAIILAGILEFAGAVLFGQEVTATLSGKIFPLHLFEDEPHLFVLSIIAELLATSLWLLAATWKGWPVASSHAAVGAIAGVNALAFGIGALDWTMLRTITLSWVLTPIASGVISAVIFTLLHNEILAQPHPTERWHHWHPWLSAAVLGLMGSLILPAVFSSALAELGQRWPLPAHDYILGAEFFGALGLMYWTTIPNLPTSEISECSLDLQQNNATLPSERQQIEHQLSKFQIVSACCMAFAHGSNDVGNAIAPLASFTVFWQTQTVPSVIETVPSWVLGLGGVGIVLGLVSLGKRVIATVGEKLLSLMPSSGFCAEIGAATTILIASQWGLPLSTTHALIGSVVGIGLVQKEALQWSNLGQIFTAWAITVPATVLLGGSVFTVLRLILH
jgi:inorganic phosphate transporter, PiT family